MRGCGGGVTDRERREREKEEWMQWTGSIRNEFPEMATHGWAELAWIREVEAGWGVERLLHVQLDGKRETERRRRERERPPGADRCSPPLQLRPHSWPGSLDISLCVYVSLSLALSPPNQNTCFNSEGYTHDRLRYVPPCSLFFI